MSGADVAAHGLSLAWGAAAALATATVFYLAGLAVHPCPPDDSAPSAEAPAFIGAALYALVCWVGIGLGVPVSRLAVGFALAVFVLAASRMRRVRAACAGRINPGILRWVLLFVAFYVLMYAFTMPSVTRDYLAPAWLGNIDLLTYTRYAKNVLHLGPSNLAYPDSSYLDWIYLRNPAVFSMLAGFSLLFGADPLNAAMPAAFGLAALLGVLAVRIARAVYGLPRWVAVTIGAVFISGPFFRYVFGEYFLSTLFSAPVLAFLVWTTASCQSLRRMHAGAALRMASAYALLLLLYPVMLAVGLGVQILVSTLLWCAEWQGDANAAGDWCEAMRRAVTRLVTAGVAAAAVGLVLLPRVVWSVRDVLSLSQKNINGWPLELISPLAILGVPGTWMNGANCRFCTDLEVTTRSGRLWAAALIVLVPLGLTLCNFWWARARTSAMQRALAVAAGGTFLIYFLFFLLTGPSYQQWKFASYLVLPWSFVVLASGASLLLGNAPARPGALSPRRRGVASTALAVAALFLTGGNLVAHVLADPAPTRLPGGLRNIASINAMPAFREVTVMMDETFDGLSSWLALYLLPDKQVHVISRRNVPNEPLDWQTVSRQRPLLMQNFGCEGIGHADTLDVPEVGCLLFAPPSLALETSYRFSQTYWFLTFTGLASREAQGRWNAGTESTLRLSADVSRVNLFGDGYVNLTVNPYLPPGTAHQRMVVSWGSGRRAEVSLGARQTLSLPIGRADWTGIRMWSLPVTTAWPDAMTPLELYTPQGQAPDARLAARFEELSVSRTAAGVVVGR